MRGVRAQGKKIRQLRLNLGLTQAQLAVRAGCDVKTARGAERGRSLDIFILRRIAAALGVPYTDVVCKGTGRPSKEARHLHLVHDWLAAFDDRDVPALVGAFRPGGVLCVPGPAELAVAGTFRGRPKLRAHYEALLATFVFKRVARSPCTVNAIDEFVHLCGSVELKCRGSGAACRLQVALAFRFEKGRVAELTVYGDTSALHRLLGNRPRAP